MEDFVEQLRDAVENGQELRQRLQACALAMADYSEDSFGLSRVKLTSWAGDDQRGVLTIEANWDIGPPGDWNTPRQGVIGGELRLSGEYSYSSNALKFSFSTCEMTEPK